MTYPCEDIKRVGYVQCAGPRSQSLCLSCVGVRALEGKSDEVVLNEIIIVVQKMLWFRKILCL